MLGMRESALTMPGTAAHHPGIRAHLRPESALTMGRNTQWKRVWLEVLSDNLAARAFCERLGFGYDPGRHRVVQRGETQIESLAMSKVL
jgi:RimJ/RimL family protein N-acetyltransferase